MSPLARPHLYYSVSNWIAISVLYPFVVHPDPFIGIVYLLEFVGNGMTFVGLWLIDRFVLRNWVKSPLLYYAGLWVLAFVFNQLSYQLTADRCPVFDLSDTHNPHYAGENKLFTLSSALTAMLVYGIAYWKQMKKEG